MRQLQLQAAVILIESALQAMAVNAIASLLLSIQTLQLVFYLSVVLVSDAKGARVLDRSEWMAVWAVSEG